MRSRRNWGRLLATGLLAVSGLIGLRQVLPLLRIDSSVCLHPAASGLGEIGLRLHVFSASAACPNGSYLPGHNFGAVVQVSFAVSVMTLVFGSMLVLGALGVGWWAAGVLRQLRSWLRRRLAVRLVPRVMAPQRALIPVAVPVRVARTLPSSQSRRGPPCGC